MSDSSDNDGDDYHRDYQEQLDYEYYRHEQESGADEEDNDPLQDGDEEEDEIEEENDNDHPILGDKSDLKLCPKHDAGEMTRSCRFCSKALSLITDKKTIKELCSSGSKDSSLSARYSGGCDAITPTLILDPDTVVLASNIFNKGVMRESKI